MQKIFLTKYSVKGVKALDKLISLSFHLSGTEKRSNIKAIYGPNGSGKSGIIASAGILQSLLVDDGYLTNPFVQECLDSIVICKKHQDSVIQRDAQAFSGTD